jgi:hypothetical protein
VGNSTNSLTNEVRTIGLAMAQRGSYANYCSFAALEYHHESRMPSALVLYCAAHGKPT